MSVRLCVMGMVMFALLVACGRGDREDAATGAALFAANCAVCHGVDARGGGGGGIEGLSKTPPDLTRLTMRNGGTFPAVEVLGVLEGYAAGGQRGRRMAGFSPLQDDDRKRARLPGQRIRTTRPLAELLVYLESVQVP